MLRSAPVLLVLAAASCATARAQDLVVLRDEWSARWVDGRKVAWTHLRVEHDPLADEEAVAYVVSSCATDVVDGDQHMTTTVVTTTNRLGEVLSERFVEASPWGTTVAEAAWAGSRLRWTRNSRDVVNQEGWIDERPEDVDIVAARLVLESFRAGEGGEVRRDVHVLDLGLTAPASVSVQTLALRRAEDGVTTVELGGRLRTRWSARGALVAHAPP